MFGFLECQSSFAIYYISYCVTELCQQLDFLDFHHKFRDDICQPSIAKIQKQLKWPSTDEWMQNLWYIHTMENYSTIKKNEILPRVMLQMNLESILLSEVSHTEKDKYHMFSLIC